MMDGALLFITSIQYLLPVLMIALLVRRVEYPRIALQAAALGIGLLIALSVLPPPGDPASLPLYARGYLIVLGLLVLADLRLHAGLVLILTLGTGGVIGLELKATVIDDPASGTLPTIGFISSSILSYLLAGLFSGVCRLGWQRIAIRVAGSWIAAIAAIDIAFMIARSG